MLWFQWTILGLMFMNIDIIKGHEMPTILANISWAHAVNEKELLKRCLNSEIDMLEADVVIGRTSDGKQTNIPIMAHPPNDISNLSLSEFVSMVDEYNKRSANKKGIKLDFKSIEAFESAITNEEFAAIVPKANYPVWLNADILEGPLAPAFTKPVNATQFIKGGKLFPRSVLSLGWTTGFNATQKAGYTESNVQEMLKTLAMHEVHQPVTFAVRAGLVAGSQGQIDTLLHNNDHTLTVWSAVNDNGFDIHKLNKILDDIGSRRIYIDVPNQLGSQLNLLKSAHVNSR